MKFHVLAAVLVCSLLAAGCASNSVPPKSGGASADLSGEGSTFVQPILEKWRLAFQASNSDVHISYLADGSGKGRASLVGNHVDFAGSDAPMNAGEMANASDALHIPVVAGGVAIVYNVPEIASPLKLDSATLTSIFLGKITTWDDAAIKALNPDANLPHADVTVVVRSDSSGTTATFTDYLSKADSRWQKANGGPGAGSTVKWPAASTTTGNGNSGVATSVQGAKYEIGYVGSDWGNISQLQQAQLKNPDGNFVSPSPATASAALDAALPSFSDQLTGSATNQPGAQSYPITAVSWIVVHQHQPDAAKAKALVAFLHYVLHDGQALNTANNYAPMPASLVAKADAIVAKIG